MPTRPPISLADLAQSFDLLRPEDEATRRRVAEALGFAAIGRAAPRPEEPAARQTAAPPRPAPGPAPLADTTPFDDLPFEPVEPEPQQPESKTQPILSFDLAGPTRGAPSGDGQSRPEWWNRITVIEKQTDPARIPPPDPLLLPAWSRTTYMQTLSTTVLEGRLDIRRLVDLVARLQAPRQIPRLPWHTMRNGVQILVDYGDAMMPFRDDQRRLVREVQALAGGSAFFEVFLFRGTPARWARPLITRRGLPAYELPPPGAPILVLTDLGIGALAAGQSYVPPEEWQAFARSAAAVGCPTTAYVPYQPDRWPPLLRGEMSLVHWHHARGAAGARAAAPSNGVGEARRLVDELAARNPQAAALAHLASLASRVELSLLRELRFALLPSADGGAEADLWFSPLASVRNETVLLLRPETAQALRRSLFQSDPALYENAWRIVDSFRQRTGAFEGTRLEEEINYWLAQEGPAATARVEELLRRAVKTVYERGEQDDEGLALWSVEMLDSLPAAARSSEAGRDLGVVAGFRMDRGYVPASALPDDIGSRQWLIPVDVASLSVASLWVGREVEGLVLADQETLLPNGQRLDEVPATTPMVVWLSWDDDKRREKVTVLPGQKTGPIPTGEHMVTIETFTGIRWTLTPTTAESPVEEAPQPGSLVQVSVSNQEVIDAFAEVIQASNLTGWALMEQNGIAMSALSADRAGVYQGPDLASLPALTEEQRAMLLARLRAAVSVAGNALETLPDEVFAYANLRRLDLSRNQLAELPARIGDFAGLEEMVLDDNRLSALPPEIGQLSALRTLSAANNALSDLPGSLSRLQRLATLTLRNNQLRSLPSWFDQLAGLKSIDLRGNPLDVAASVLEQVDRPRAVLAALARSGPAEADLEILIFPHSGASYGVTLRFRRPDAGQDKTLSASWTLDEAALRQREHDPTAYGEELAAQLLAGPDARGFLDQTLAVAASQQTPLHLRLFISGEAEALHSLRWETLRLPASAAPLAVSEWVRFSRYVDSDNWRQVTAAPQETLRAVIAIAGPDVSGTTLAEVRMDEELAAARAGLAGIPAVELAARGQVTLPSLLARLRDGCDILYLVAHGMIVDGEPQVLLEREDGGRAWTSGRELAARLGELAKPPSLAVLVSCQSAGADGKWLSLDDGALAGFGPRLAAAGVPAVVAMQGNSTMTTAAAFVPAFLAELRRNGQVDRAMAVARGAVRERPDWWMPVLFTRLLDGRLFAPAAQTPLEWRHFSDGIVYVNGIDAETGAPLVEPMDFATLAAIIKGQPVDRTKAQEMTAISQLHTKPSLGLPDGVSATDVTKAGWAARLEILVGQAQSWRRQRLSSESALLPATCGWT